MSLKTAYFEAKLKAGPAVKHNYLVQIPGFTSLAYLVSNVPLPAPSRGMSSITFMGETYSFPTAVDLASGEISVTLYETATMEVVHAFYDAYIRGVSDGKSRLFDIDLLSYQMNYAFPVITRLLGCWVKGFTNYTLDSSAYADVVSCTLSLQYNGVELVENSGNNPLVNYLAGAKQEAFARASSSVEHIVDPLLESLGLGFSPANISKRSDIDKASVMASLNLINSVLKV